jgi:hypothetical protein
MEESSGQSTMVWHGTPIPNVHSILRGGFKVSVDGYVWSAEDAVISYDYSFKYAVWQDSVTRTWKNSPYKGWGVLFVFEAAGGGQRVSYWGPNYFACVMKEPDSILVRYIFLLFPKEFATKHRAPERRKTEP